MDNTDKNVPQFPSSGQGKNVPPRPIVSIDKPVGPPAILFPPQNYTLGPQEMSQQPPVAPQPPYDSQYGFLPQQAAYGVTQPPVDTKPVKSPVALVVLGAVFLVIALFFNWYVGFAGLGVVIAGHKTLKQLQLVGDKGTSLTVIALVLGYLNIAIGVLMLGLYLLAASVS